MAGGLKVIVNEGLGAGMQRQIPRLAAFAGHLEMRHAFTGVLRVLDLELAQLLAPQRVKQQGREDRAVALALDRVGLGRVEQLAGLVIAERRRLAFAALRPRPLDAFDRVVGHGVSLAEIFEQRGSEASRCRIVLPPRPRRTRSSRQAMMCARVTARNSSGRRMPAKRMKSRTAFS